MHSASDANPGLPRGAIVESRLVDAYKETFRGEDGEMVLVDLANWSGFYRSMGPNKTPDERAFQDGMRFLFERVVTLLGREGREWQELRARAAAEHRIDYPEVNGPLAQGGPLDDYD